MISVGLLVDNSVVVAENIYRFHREGLPRREAAIRGAGEITLAVVMATLTTVAVFLPVSLVEGEGQFFLLRLSIPISVSLLGSLLVALVVVPLAAYLTLPDGAARGDAPRGRFHRLRQALDRATKRVYDGTLGRVNHLYGRILAVALVRRGDLVLILLLAFAATIGVISSKKVRFVAQDENQRPGFGIRVELPQSYTFEETEEYFDQVEKILEAQQEELGLDGYLIFHRTQFGSIEGWLPTDRDRPFTPRQVTEQLLEALPERPGIELFTGDDSDGEDDKLAVHTFLLNGEDPTELEAVGKALEGLFAQVEGVLGVRRRQEESPNELALVVDRERAQLQDVNPAVIAGVVSYALRGQGLPEFHVDGREIPVRVRFEEEDRESLAELKDFAVPLGPQGDQGAVSLSSITDVRFLSAATTIRRRDRRLARAVSLELEEGKEEETRERLRALAAQIDLPEGVSFQAGDGPVGMDEELKGLLYAAGLAIVFIFLLMGFLFESALLPVSILATIPLALFGVVWTHLLAGLDIDFLGVVGLVLLIGVVVNNGIVLIDYVNRLRRGGHGREEALSLACERRFRPIMMTALTTVFGMVPLTLAGTTSIGISYVSFAYTLIGGLTVSTLLTLFVVPVFYTVVEDTRARVLGVLARGWRRPAPRQEGAEVAAETGGGG
jgi:HAE1 family hydrophobic/amphiphilic exporter-1